MSRLLFHSSCLDGLGLSIFQIYWYFYGLTFDFDFMTKKDRLVYKCLLCLKHTLKEQAQNLCITAWVKHLQANQNKD